MNDKTEYIIGKIEFGKSTNKGKQMRNIEDFKKAMDDVRNTSSVIVPDDTLDAVRITEKYLTELETEYQNTIDNRHMDIDDFQIEERVRRCRYLTAQQSAIIEVLSRMKGE